MQKIVFVVTALFLFTLGCQSTRSPHWLTPPKGSGPKFLGQVPDNDPFPNSPFPNIVHTPPNTVNTPPNAINPQYPAANPPAFDSQFAAQPVQHSVFEPFAPIQQGAMTSDRAADDERERLRELAMAPQVGTASYLRPFSPWNGPFATRTRHKNIEHDIIRQVGGGEYEPVSIASDNLAFDWEQEVPQKGFNWSMLDPAKSISRIRDWAGLGPDESKANEAMQKGKEILRSNPDLQDKKKNLEAAKHFVEAAKKYPDSVLEEDALYLAGECYYFSEDYPSAVSAYQKLLIKYRHSKHVDTAVRRMFRIGQYWELAAERSVSNFNFTDKSLPQYDTFGFAKKVYETIFIHDPNGPVSDAALMALATAYLKRGRYQGDHNFNQAAMYYRQLREDYPLSPYLAKACENELYARTQAYMGPDYPGRTLEEAKKLAEITVRQFGSELDGEGKADIMEIRENILEKKAEQLWSRGQHYDLKKRYYGSARLMYEQLIAEYPQTEYAERARKRLTVIEGLPDVPPILGLPINPFKAD